MTFRTCVRVALVIVTIGAALLLAAEPPVCPVTPPASQPAAASQPAQGPWAAMFPDGLTDAQGKSVSLDSLQGKVVGVYFSAHWCPPCRAFTPALVKYRDAHQADLEIVLVDLDHSAKDMQEYMTGQNMKWPSVPFQSKSATALLAKYAVEGIPTLVILSPKGNTVTRDGREDVTADPDHCLAQWKQAAAKADGK